MTIDVLRGDVLTANSKDYVIKHVGDWDSDVLNSAAFQAMANVSCVIKRQPFSTGAAGTPITKYTGNCTPLDPIGFGIQQRIKLRTPSEALQTFVADSDGCKHLILEDQKT